MLPAGTSAVGRRRAGRVGGRTADTALRPSTVTSRYGDTLLFAALYNFNSGLYRPIVNFFLSLTVSFCNPMNGLFINPWLFQSITTILRGKWVYQLALPTVCYIRHRNRRAYLCTKCSYLWKEMVHNGGFIATESLTACRDFYTRALTRCIKIEFRFLCH